MDNDENTLRLNILALPNQQKVIVVMLALVVLGTLLAIGYNTPQSLFLVLAVLLLVLSFRRVLAGFEATQRKLGLHQAGEAFEPLQQRITWLSRERLGLTQTPMLAIAARGEPIHVVATWWRWYVAVETLYAQQLQAMLADPNPQQRRLGDFTVLHELHHLKHGDNIWLEYARALLNLGIRLILWFALLLVGLVILLSFVQVSFFANVTPATVSALSETYLPGSGENLVTTLFGSVEEFESLAERVRATDFGQVLFNVLANTLPYILVCPLILGLYWRRLLRLREFYADSGAAQGLGDAEPILFWRNSNTFRAPTSPTDHLRQRWEQFGQWLFPTHPPISERKTMLEAPETINGSARSYGITVGLYVLALNLIMYSTSAVAFTGLWPMHFPIVAPTVLISLYMLTPLALGQPIARPFWVALGWVVGVHGCAIIFSLGILALLAIFDPAQMQLLLEASARNLTWYTRIDPSLVGGDAATLLATATAVNLVQIPLVLLFSAGALALIARLARRILCWYSLPNAERRLMHWVYAVISCVSACVALVLLPPASDIALQRPAQALSWPSPVYWLLVVVTLGITAFTGWRFIALDREHAHRCPTCAASVPKAFALGDRCPKCQALLHSWLVASYAFTVRTRNAMRGPQQ